MFSFQPIFKPLLNLSVQVVGFRRVDGDAGWWMTRVAEVQLQVGIENDPIVNSDALVASLTGSTAGTASSLPQPLNLKVGNAYYCSAPLAADMTVFGQPSLQIYTASGVKAILLTGKIYDVAPDGKAQLVTRGVTRHSAASGLTPTLVSFQTFADYHRFAKGHRIAIELAASDFPSYQSDLTNAVTQVFHDNSLPSKIVFPVLR